MNLLCVSDLHADLAACSAVVARSDSVDVVVLAGQNRRAVLQYSHFGAVGGHHRGELETDVAASEDHQTVRPG